MKKGHLKVAALSLAQAVFIWYLINTEPWISIKSPESIFLWFTIAILAYAVMKNVDEKE